MIAIGVGVIVIILLLLFAFKEKFGSTSVPAPVVGETTSPEIILATSTEVAPSTTTPAKITMEPKVAVPTKQIQIVSTVTATPSPKPASAPVVTAPPPAPPKDIFVTPQVSEPTFTVSAVPLLIGGAAKAGESVAVSYLKITNIGKKPATLEGFTIQQNGSAPGLSVVGLSTVDDKGGSRGYVGGPEGTTPFVGIQAVAPTLASFEPGQMRLFTIKAVIGSNISAYAGTQLMIEVSSLKTDAEVKGSFPIRGTTWTLQ
jgi:hypothetical protein